MGLQRFRAAIWPILGIILGVVFAVFVLDVEPNTGFVMVAVMGAFGGIAGAIFGDGLLHARESEDSHSRHDPDDRRL